MNTGQLGDRVKKRREELRVAQAELAALAGVSVHTLSNLEQGSGNPTLKVVERVLEALGLELCVRARGPGKP